MRYSTLYKKFIAKRVAEKRKEDDPRYTLHHILPRSMGGKDVKENRVPLTPKEHYIAHRLLAHSYKKKHPEICYLLNNFAGGMKGQDSPKLADFNFYVAKAAGFRKMATPPKAMAKFIEIATEETKKILFDVPGVNKELILQRLFEHTFTK